MALISVITPCFNGVKFLPEYFKGIAIQTHKDVEWIIVDDNSIDASLSEIAKQIEHYRLQQSVKVIRLSKNHGPVYARNVAIEAAVGAYLAFLDIDDVWLPNKLMTQLQAMEALDAAISATAYRHMSYDGTKVGRVISPKINLNFSGLHYSRRIGCLTVMLNRRKISDFKFPSTHLLAEDFIAWAEVLSRGHTIYGIGTDLARYRIALQSRSSNKIKAVSDAWQIYRVIEKLPLLKAIPWFSGFLLDSFYKHTICAPAIKRADIDRL